MAWGGKSGQVSQQKNKKNRLKIGEQFKKAKKWLKGDKNPLQDRLNKKANIANTGSGKKTAAGRIQKKLVESGFQKSELRRKQESHAKWKSDRAKMKKMRKENPEKYRKIKKEQRKKEREAAFRNPGVRD
tara:strand:+ start:55 stop:444 length:390 start_codon:yes stop_codon:yes gene_type:complete